MAPRKASGKASAAAKPEAKLQAKTKAVPKKAAKPKAIQNLSVQSVSPIARAQSRADEPLSMGYLTVPEVLRSASTLTKRLMKVHELLSVADQDTEDESLVKRYTEVASALGSIPILSQKDREVRALTACALADVIRIFAPEAPFDDHQLKRIFGLFIEQLTGLADPESPLYEKYFYLLERLAVVKAFVLLLDVYEDDLIVQLFDMLFDSINDQHSTAVRSYMVDVMVSVINESRDNLSNKVLEAILINLVSPFKRENPDAYRLSQHVIQRCADALEADISQLVVDLKAPVEDPNTERIGGSSSARSADDIEMSELREHVHELIFELNRINPSLLSRGVFQVLQVEMVADDLTVRRQAVALLARMYAVPDSRLAAEDAKFSHILKRFDDVDEQIRQTMVEFGQVFLLNHAPPRIVAPNVDAHSAVVRNASDVFLHLSQRTQDPIESIRVRAVEALCSLGVREPSSVDVDGFSAVKRAFRDKRPAVRRVALKGCVDVWRHLGCDVDDWSSDSRRKFGWIPATVLLQYAVASALDERESVQEKLSVQKEIARAIAGHTPGLFAAEEIEDENGTTTSADFSAAASRTAQNLLWTVGSVDDKAVQSWVVLMHDMRRFQAAVAQLAKLRLKGKGTRAAIQNEDLNAVRAVAVEIPSADSAQEQLVKLFTLRDATAWEHIATLACVKVEGLEAVEILPSTEEVVFAQNALLNLPGVKKLPVIEQLCTKLAPVLVARDVCTSLLRGRGADPAADSASDSDEILNAPGLNGRRKGTKSHVKRKKLSISTQVPIDSNALRVLEKISQIYPMALALQATGITTASPGAQRIVAPGESTEDMLAEILAFFDADDRNIVDRALRLLQNKQTASTLGQGVAGPKYTRSLQLLKQRLFGICSEGVKGSHSELVSCAHAKLAARAIFYVFAHRLDTKKKPMHLQLFADLLEDLREQWTVADNNLHPRMLPALYVARVVAELAPDVFERFRDDFILDCWTPLKDDGSLAVIKAVKVLVRQIIGVGVLINDHLLRERKDPSSAGEKHSVQIRTDFDSAIVYVRTLLFGADGVFASSPRSSPSLISVCAEQMVVLAVRGPQLEQQFISPMLFAQMSTTLATLPVKPEHRTIALANSQGDLEEHGPAADELISHRLLFIRKLSKWCSQHAFVIGARYLALIAMVSVARQNLGVHESAQSRRLLRECISSKRDLIKGQEELVHANPQLQQRLYSEYSLPHLVWLIAHDPFFTRDAGGEPTADSGPEQFATTSSRLEFLLDQLWFATAHGNNVHRLRALLEGLRGFASVEPEGALPASKRIERVIEFTLRCYQVEEIAQLLITRKAEHGSWSSVSDADAIAAKKTLRLPASLFCNVSRYEIVGPKLIEPLEELVLRRGESVLPESFKLPQHRKHAVSTPSAAMRKSAVASRSSSGAREKKLKIKKSKASPRAGSRRSSRSSAHRRVSYRDDLSSSESDDSAELSVSAAVSSDEEIPAPTPVVSRRGIKRVSPVSVGTTMPREDAEARGEDDDEPEARVERGRRSPSKKTRRR